MAKFATSRRDVAAVVIVVVVLLAGGLPATRVSAQGASITGLKTTGIGLPYNTAGEPVMTRPSEYQGGPFGPSAITPQGNGPSKLPTRPTYDAATAGWWVGFLSLSSNWYLAMSPYYVDNAYCWNTSTQAIWMMSFNPTPGSGKESAYEACSQVKSCEVPGRYVFFTRAPNLQGPGSSGDPKHQVFLFDFQSGTPSLVSQLNGAVADSAATNPTMTPDGQTLFFTCSTASWVPGAPQHAIWKLSFASGLMEPLASLYAVGDLESDRAGNFLSLSKSYNDAGTSMCPLTPGFLPWVFYYSVSSQQFQQVLGINGACPTAPPPLFVFTSDASISGNGRFIAYSTAANNMVQGDTNNQTDIFVFDRVTGTNRLVSQGMNGLPANGSSITPSISRDGALVAFVSLATNLVPGDVGGSRNIYVVDLVTNEVALLTPSYLGSPSNGDSFNPEIARHGSKCAVAFDSEASNLAFGDGNSVRDVFLSEFTCSSKLSPFTELGSGLAGGAGVPEFSGAGTLVAGEPGSLMLSSASPSSSAQLFVALSSNPVAFKGGDLVAFPFIIAVPLSTDSNGGLTLPFVWPAGIPGGTLLYMQYAVQDAGAPQGVALSNALLAETP